MMMSDESTLRVERALEARVAPAPSVGRFVWSSVGDPGALDSALAPIAARAAGDGSVRCLERAGRQLIGLFDLVQGQPESALDPDLEAPWQGWRGRFCFVLVEPEQRHIRAVVDHFSTLPLYYSTQGEQLALGNWLRPLMRLPWCARRVDPVALFHYLNFACVPAPRTVLPEVRRLPPASQLEWRDGASSVSRYWRPPYAEDLDGDPANLAGELRERMVATVQRYRPPAATEWGCFLSGGTDSSSITSILAAQHPGEVVHSYSIGFAEADYDELDFARIAATACAAQGHFGSVDEHETLQVLPQLVSLYDQPFGNASAVPTLACASMAARDGRNLLIAGDGGDEIFGGNERYAKDRIMQAWHRLPALLRWPVRAVSRRLGGGRSRLLNRVDNFTRRAGLPNPDRFYLDDAFASEHFDALMGEALHDQVQPDASLAWMRSVWSECRAGSELHRLMALDLELAIAQNDLIKVDGACRHVGVGARFPYLDPDLVAYCGRLKAHWKVRGQDKRHLFKQAVQGILPEQILRKPKQGFGLPVSVWIRERPVFRDWLTDLLLSQRSRERGWFRSDFVQALLDHHLAGGWDHSAHLWQLAVAELWMREHLDG